MKKSFSFLGWKVKNKIDGFEGVVTSICFDVNGCIQAAVHPKVGKDGRIPDSRWVDLKTLDKVGTGPVVEQPTFQHVPGGHAMPAFRENPIR